MMWMDTRWRDSARQIKIGPLDARLIIFFVLWMVNPNKPLLILAAIALTFFYILDYMGYTLPNAIRKIKVIISGKRKVGTHEWRQPKFRH